VNPKDLGIQDAPESSTTVGSPGSSLTAASENEAEENTMNDVNFQKAALSSSSDDENQEPAFGVGSKKPSSGSWNNEEDIPMMDSDSDGGSMDVTQSKETPSGSAQHADEDPMVGIQSVITAKESSGSEQRVNEGSEQRVDEDHPMNDVESDSQATIAVMSKQPISDSVEVEVSHSVGVEGESQTADVAMSKQPISDPEVVEERQATNGINSMRLTDPIVGSIPRLSIKLSAPFQPRRSERNLTEKPKPDLKLVLPRESSGRKRKPASKKNEIPPEASVQMSYPVKID
jgi:hypothetical protein